MMIKKCWDFTAKKTEKTQFFTKIPLISTVSTIWDFIYRCRNLSCRVLDINCINCISVLIAVCEKNTIIHVGILHVVSCVCVYMFQNTVDIVDIQECGIQKTRENTVDIVDNTVDVDSGPIGVRE